MCPTPKTLSAASAPTTLDKPKPAANIDRRGPPFLGDWKKSIPYESNTIADDDLDEPHIKRKHAILHAHPEIKNLYGTDKRTILIGAAGTLTQLACTYFWGRVWTGSIWWLVAAAYIVGGTLTSFFGVIIHEATHGLCHPSIAVNRAVGFMANICIPFPIFSSFRRYHLEHHAYQGVYDRDPDLPLQWEIIFARGNPVMKFLFLFFYPLMYVVRGAVMGKKPSFWEIVNALFTITTDAIIWKVCGAKGFLYIFLSLWLGYGVHPGAAHFIQEHYTFDDGQETYSYYGPLNWFYLNIGYHNEHHDFTKVPWSGLRRIRAIAPEYYDTLNYHMSWTKVLIDFVLRPDVGPQSRVGRDWEDHKAGRKLLVRRDDVVPDGEYEDEPTLDRMEGEGAKAKAE